MAEISKKNLNPADTAKKARSEAQIEISGCELAIEKITNGRARGKKFGLIFGSILSAIYALVFVVWGSSNSAFYYAIIGTPLAFLFFYSSFYCIASGYIFLTPSQMGKLYDNPIDNYFRSPFRQEINKTFGGCLLSVIVNIATSLFFMVFGFIFYFIFKNYERKTLRDAKERLIIAQEKLKGMKK